MSNLHVIFKIADMEYAIPANDIYRMESFTGATPIPGSAPFVTGLVQVRQQVVGVLNMRVRMGLPATKPTLESRVIVLKRAGKLIGFLVDSAREVQNISSEQFNAPPEILSHQCGGFIKAIAQIKDRMIMLLDAVKVIEEETAHV